MENFIFHDAMRSSIQTVLVSALLKHTFHAAESTLSHLERNKNRN